MALEICSQFGNSADSRHRKKIRAIVENVMLLNWLRQLCCHMHRCSDVSVHGFCTQAHSSILFNLLTFSHCDQRNVEREKKNYL